MILSLAVEHNSQSRKAYFVYVFYWDLFMFYLRLMIQYDVYLKQDTGALTTTNST